MTVKELINKLLDAPMEANVTFAVRTDMAADDDVDIYAVRVQINSYARAGAYVELEGDS